MNKEEAQQDVPDIAGSFARELGRKGLLLSVIEIAGAVALVVIVVVSPDRPAELLARVGGLLLVAASTITIWHRLVADERWWSRILISIAGIGVGVWLVLGGLGRLALSEALLEAVLSIILIGTAATGVLRVALRLGVTKLADTEPGDNRWLLTRWIDARGQIQQDLDAIHAQVFFEGADAWTRLGRFALMMFFASVISAAGVVTDSTAVVIGAMLIAPLINPMMGMGLGLVAGWPNRLGRSTLLTLAGISIAAGTGWLLASAVNLAVDLDTNTQITSRSSPTVTDLVIAVAAGAAGAYALSRKDVSSSLPGVAVAIALVPPLSVVGITAQGGDWEQAAGTLVLFVTNLVAIILAGGAVFVLTGVVPVQRVAHNQHRVKTAAVAIGVLTLVTIGLLAVNGRQITRDSLDADQAQTVVTDWLGEGADFSIISVSVDDGNAAVVLAGPDKPPDVQSLADLMAASLDRQVTVDLQWVQRQRDRATSSD